MFVFVYLFLCRFNDNLKAIHKGLTCGGLVVSFDALFCNDPSSNPAAVNLQFFYL